MSIGTTVKVGLVKAWLNHLKSIDGGTTVAGTLAAILMATGFVNLGLLMGSGTPLQQGIEAAKVAGVFAFWLVMRLIGKPIDVQTAIADAEEAMQEAAGSTAAKKGA